MVGLLLLLPLYYEFRVFNDFRTTYQDKKISKYISLWTAGKETSCMRCVSHTGDVKKNSPATD